MRQPTQIHHQQLLKERLIIQQEPILQAEQLMMEVQELTPQQGPKIGLHPHLLLQQEHHQQQLHQELSVQHHLQLQIQIKEAIHLHVLRAVVDRPPHLDLQAMDVHIHHQVQGVQVQVRDLVLPLEVLLLRQDPLHQVVHQLLEEGNKCKLDH
jgi:hypothetical protein